MPTDQNKNNKPFFKKLYISISGGLAAVILLLGQVKEVRDMTLNAIQYVSDYGRQIYYRQESTTNALAIQLLQKTYPSFKSCNVQGRWFDAHGGGDFSQLLVTYQNCNVSAQCNELAGDEKENCINDEFRWGDLSATVFIYRNKDYEYTGEFKTRAIYSEVVKL